MRLLLSCVAAALAFGLAAVPAQSQHDGWAFWLPSGELDYANNDSVKARNWSGEGAELSAVKGPNGTGALMTVNGRETFTVSLRRTRFEIPKGHLVIVRTARGDETATALNVTIGSDRAPNWNLLRGKKGRNHTDLYFVPRQFTAGKREITLTLRPVGGAAISGGYRFYLTDDLDHASNTREADLLHGVTTAYPAGLHQLFNGNFGEAAKRFREMAAAAGSPEEARLARRLTRLAEANQRFSRLNKRDGAAAYRLGLYALTNGFYDLAEAALRTATEASPNNPDYWYLRGNAAAYKYSDLDRRMREVYPFYRRAADLYPRENSNTYRNWIGFFNQLRLKDGQGREYVQNMSAEQKTYIREAWEWISAIMESASKGALRMQNTIVEIDKEYDNTAHFAPEPFADLFKPHEADVLVKFTGWGASDALGHDCGPNRTASINLGIREWDVLLHEWNHTLDWLMIFSETGKGVPETHASDWCGFQPISSMGMGHQSANRYYMTPGMYRAVRGNDPATTPFLGEWRLSEPQTLQGATPMTDPAHNALREQVGRMQPGRVGGATARAQNGYVDLKAALPNAGPNAVVFAETWVYSPKDQKVRLWVGADDNLRLWINGQLVHQGLYWAVAEWEEARERDQLATPQWLRKGWNRLTVQVSNLARTNPKPGRPDQWGFSARISDYQNREVAGLRTQAERPTSDLAQAPAVNTAQPATFNWERVRDDYTMDTPALTLEQLRAITGQSGLEVLEERFADLKGQRAVGPFLKAGLPALMGGLAQVVPFERNGRPRHLVLLKPEFYEAFMELAPVGREARAQGIRRHADQVIGHWIGPFGGHPNGRIALVLDTYLGPDLPADSEDLLTLR